MSLRSVPVRYRLSLLLFALSGVAFLDRTNISIAGLQISADFGLTHQTLGWVFSAFLLGYAALQVPAGWMAARFGPRRVLAIGTLWWGVATALVALLPGTLPHALVYLLVLRMLLGAGESVVYPAANQFVARWVPLKERGFINGLIFAGVGAGSGLTPPLLYWIISHHGWRTAFWCSAVVGMAVGSVWWFQARDTPQQHPLVRAEELAVIRSGLRPPNSGEIDDAAVTHPITESQGSAKIPWHEIFVRRDLVALSFGYFCFGYISWIFFSWFYLYMAQVRGLDLKSSAQYAMLPFLSMTLCCMAGGAFSDWLTLRYGLRAGRCWLASGALCLTACFLLLGSHVGSAPLAAVTLAGGAGALYLSQSSFFSVAIDIAGRSSGIFSSVVNMGGQIGGAVTASLTPWIAKRFGWTMSFGTAAMFALIGAVCWLMVHPERSLGEE